MNKLQVTKVESESIEFENGIKLFSEHEQDCCENHYLSFSDLTIDDFTGLVFDLTNDDFFRRVEGYGIELIPVKGFSIKVPGYGYNNGYYGTNITLVVSGDGFRKEYDVSECQLISE